jgi:hypothetical protein
MARHKTDKQTLAQLTKEVPEVFGAEVDFDAVVMRVLAVGPDSAHESRKSRQKRRVTSPSRTK